MAVTISGNGGINLNSTPIGAFLGIEVLGPWSLSGDTEVGLSAQPTGTSGTWTRPTGCNHVLVYVTGGGGGSNYAGASYRGCGGGGGGTAVKWIANVTSSVSYTVGGGGAPGQGASQAGNGGTSSFGSYCTAYGGIGGVDNYPYGARGGGASGGDMNIPGGCTRYAHSGSNDSNGGSTFWGTMSAGPHRPNSGSIITSHGRWGGGGSTGYDSQQQTSWMYGGAGVIVIFKYA